MAKDSPRHERSPQDALQDALQDEVQRLQAALLRAEQELDSANQRAAQAEALALVDPLTQLPNRRAWEQALAREERRCQRAKHPAAIICLDLDRLKEQNDTAGHAAGDELLQHTADALRKAIRAHDIAAQSRRRRVRHLAGRMRRRVRTDDSRAPAQSTRRRGRVRNAWLGRADKRHRLAQDMAIGRSVTNRGETQVGPASSGRGSKLQWLPILHAKRGGL